MDATTAKWEWHRTMDVGPVVTDSVVITRNGASCPCAPLLVPLGSLRRVCEAVLVTSHNSALLGSLSFSVWGTQEQDDAASGSEPATLQPTALQPTASIAQPTTSQLPTSPLTASQLSTSQPAEPAACQPASPVAHRALATVPQQHLPAPHRRPHGAPCGAEPICARADPPDPRLSLGDLDRLVHRRPVHRSL